MPILENFEYLSINSARKIMLIGFRNKIKKDIFIRSKDLKNNSGWDLFKTNFWFIHLLILNLQSNLSFVHW